MKLPSAPLSFRWARVVTLTLVFSGCAAGPKHSAAPPEPYMRIAYPDADTVQLQIAVRQFKPARRAGPIIWLAGASHIGESNYYGALQKQLDAQTVVLYEGVGEHPRKPRGHPAASRPAAPTPARPGGATPEAPGGPGSLQLQMATSLGLVFQMEAIDYDRTNFFNSDLTIQQLQALMEPAAKGTHAAPADNALQDLLRAMDGRSAFGAIAGALLQIVAGSPKLQAITKLALIEAFGALKGDMSQMQGVPEELKQLLDVLIRERNKAVMKDLRAELKTARKTDSIAIFYGAGHLADLEKRLRRELNYVPGEQLWLPAFSVNTTSAGLSNFELSLMRSLIRSQLSPLTQ
jgi:hypothetical protein